MAANEDWQRVGEAIAARVKALSLTQAEIAAAGGPTDKTLRGYTEGKPIVRADKRRELCRILGWRVESIDSLLDGGRPILLAVEGPADTTDTAARLARLSPAAQRYIKEFIDAEERRLDEP